MTYATARLEKYSFDQKQKLQALILRREPTEGTLPDRILKLIESEPVAVDTILFDGYMERVGDLIKSNQKLIDQFEKSEES